MSCYAAHQLADYAAGVASAQDKIRIAGHLDGCGECSAVLARVGGARAALADIFEMTPPLSAAGAARTEATLRWTRPQSLVAPARRRRWAMVATTSGLAMAAAAALLVWRANRTPATVTPPASPAPIVAAPSLPVTPVTPQPTRAVVTLLSGNVKLRHPPRAEEALRAQHALEAGDQLITQTGGRVAFQWGEGSAALVGGGSDLALTKLEPRAQELLLAHGRVSVRVGPHQPGESLRVLTPTHVVTVHGTWFIVAADGRGTTVEVLEGVIEVAPRDGATATRLAAPSRAFFPARAGLHPTGEGVRAFTAREAAALRLQSEMNLLVWPAVDGGGLDPLLSTTGVLQVSTDPQASIAVDGVAFGAGSLLLRRPRGQHLVELSRAGFGTVSRWVSVGAEPGELHAALLPEREHAAPKLVVPPPTDELQSVARSRRRQVSACYEHSLKRDPTLAGTVSLTIRIGDAGQVVGTAVETNTVPDDNVAECLRREAAGWSFPTARNATVVYPFVFRTP